MDLGTLTEVELKLCHWRFGVSNMLNVFGFGYTLPKTNIAPEKWWLGNYFPFGKPFRVRKCQGGLNHVHFTCMGVSENGGTPKSSNLIGISIIHFGVPLFLETPTCSSLVTWSLRFVRRSRWTWRSDGAKKETRAESLRKGACGWDGNCRLGALLIVEMVQGL